MSMRKQDILSQIGYQPEEIPKTLIRSTQLNKVPNMQTKTSEMCRFLAENQASSQGNAELYNTFLMQTQNKLCASANQNTEDGGEECWCRYEEFQRLRTLPKEVLKFLGGISYARVFGSTEKKL